MSNHRPTTDGAQDQALSQYILDHSSPEGDYLYRLWRATNVYLLHGRMASGHLQGRLLKMLVTMLRPQHVLEVGTFSGYSALCIAEGLAAIDSSVSSPSPSSPLSAPTPSPSAEVPSGAVSQHPSSSPHLWTFEINDEQEDFTRPWIEQSSYASYITFLIGDATTGAARLGITFDLVFLDGDKRTYVETYEAVLALLRPGGYILADNTLWDGHVCDPAYDHDHQTLGIRRFNDHVAQDARVEQVILPLRDGLTIIRKK